LTIEIDSLNCSGCGNCAEICPGGLISLVDGKAAILRPEDCWGCAACLKECPDSLVSLRLPPALGGRGGFLKCRREAGRLLWLYFQGPGDGEPLVVDGEGREDGY
jgi:adenylylsulfate reductase subunit B